MHSDNFPSDHMNRIPLAIFLIEDDGGKFLEETAAPTPTIPSTKGKILLVQVSTYFPTENPYLPKHSLDSEI